MASRDEGGESDCSSLGQNTFCTSARAAANRETTLIQQDNTIVSFQTAKLYDIQDGIPTHATFQFDLIWTGLDLCHSF